MLCIKTGVKTGFWSKKIKLWPRNSRPNFGVQNVLELFYLKSPRNSRSEGLGPKSPKNNLLVQNLHFRPKSFLSQNFSQ